MPTPASPVILLAEDDDALRDFVGASLAEFGYRVIDVNTGDAAWMVLASDQRVDLLFADVFMPGALSGEDLASRAPVERDGLKVLLMSGSNPRDFSIPKATHFLPKPFKVGELLRAVEQALYA